MRYWKLHCNIFCVFWKPMHAESNFFCDNSKLQNKLFELLKFNMACKKLFIAYGLQENNLMHQSKNCLACMCWNINLQIEKELLSKLFICLLQIWRRQMKKSEKMDTDHYLRISRIKMKNRNISALLLCRLQ